MKQRKRNKVANKRVVTPARIEHERYTHLNARLDRIDARLSRLAVPHDISEQLSQLDVQLSELYSVTKESAIKYGAVAGAMSGGVAGLMVSTAFLLLRSKLGM
ncbi:hypothetical protein EY403_08310 [Shigella sonnei]|uniref:hypothetical protein n=1 Tax=Shigella sonnei TaxID=624 RepID=UPI000972FA41|nr:hypothetical protein [Shigella sonnei]EEZ5537895.1 hypothetical protein [Escherichia coli]EEZ5551867.1 hypothetical protein [Escherichia coli]EFX1701600.1 hypothetical protein [Shigella sonnei]EFX1719063.1 hypothetical protein [Shigella sonnei]EFX2368285.1 hypothetical protein [Shigella sonnei]